MREAQFQLQDSEHNALESYSIRYNNQTSNNKPTWTNKKPAENLTNYVISIIVSHQQNSFLQGWKLWILKFPGTMQFV